LLASRREIRCSVALSVPLHTKVFDSVKSQQDPSKIVDSTTVEGTGAALTDAGTPAALGRWPRQTVFSDGGMGETGMH
jgi:hypothetical protein